MNMNILQVRYVFTYVYIHSGPGRHLDSYISR
jgi:hypothetical protein